MKKVRFTDCGNDVPVIALQADRRIYLAMIDTGSQMTLFNKCLPFYELEKSKHDAEFTTAGSVTNSKVSAASLTANLLATDSTFFEQRIEGMCLYNSDVFKNASAQLEVNIDIIIGSDFLEKENVKVDFKSHSLVF